jgi:hypothetical protein
MVGNKNVRLALIMRGFINALHIYKNEEEPQISPEHAKPKDHISAFYAAKEGGHDNERKDEEHDRHKEDDGINVIDKKKGFEEPVHY